MDRRENLFGVSRASLALVCAVLGAFIALWLLVGVGGLAGTQFAIFIGSPQVRY